MEWEVADYDRSNPADDQVPVLRHAEWSNGLDVYNILCAVSWPDIEVEVFLNRNADKIRHRILHRISQRVGIYRAGDDVVTKAIEHKRPD